MPTPLGLPWPPREFGTFGPVVRLPVAAAIVAMTTTLSGVCRIDTLTDGPNQAVEISGALDWHSAPELTSAVSSVPPGGRLLLDLTGVAAIDSAGTGALIAAHLRVRRQAAHLAILTGRACAEVVEAVGISEAMPVFSERAGAYAWLSGARAGYPPGR